ncbi:MAG: dethiobiotin synthetase, partial [Solirubrobacteraceae bacterium]
MPRRALHVAVIGASQATAELEGLAEAVGHGLAAAGAIVITGGGPGVMAAASRGADAAGGVVVGILPG